MGAFGDRMMGATMTKAQLWVKRLGFWAFLFFFVKGLLWLIVPAVIAMTAFASN